VLGIGGPKRLLEAADFDGRCPRSRTAVSGPANGAGRQWFRYAKEAAVSRKREEQFEAPGKDSFLDVVANVVAILIILVIVVGSQASKTVIDKESRKRQELEASLETPLREVAAAEAESGAVESGVH